MKKREEEIDSAAKEYTSGDIIFDDPCEELCALNGFKSGSSWADKHPSKELIEKIINLAFDEWDSIEDFSDLAQSIKEEIENEIS